MLSFPCPFPFPSALVRPYRSSAPPAKLPSEEIQPAGLSLFTASLSNRFRTIAPSCCSVNLGLAASRSLRAFPSRPSHSLTTRNFFRCNSWMSCLIGPSDSLPSARQIQSRLIHGTMQPRAQASVLQAESGSLFVRRRRRLAVLRLKALETRPGFQQRAVHGEMFVADQPLAPRLLDHPRQKLFGHVGL